MAVWGAGYSGLVYPAIFSLYSKIIPGLGLSGQRAVTFKMIGENFIHYPLYLPAFFIGTGTMRGDDPAETVARLKERYLPTLGMMWVIYLPALYANFAFVPQHAQIFFINGVGFIWNSLLSLVANSSSETQRAALGQRQDLLSTA